VEDPVSGQGWSQAGSQVELVRTNADRRRRGLTLPVAIALAGVFAAGGAGAVAWRWQDGAGSGLQHCLGGPLVGGPVLPVSAATANCHVLLPKGNGIVSMFKQLG
jgi:hypothetical protein